MKISANLILVAVVAILAPRDSWATRIDRDVPRFHLEIPAGFEDFPDAKSAMPSLWRGFRRPSGDAFAFIGVEILDGTIGREPLNLKSIAEAAQIRAPLLPVQVSLTHWKWRQFDLEVVVNESGSGDQLATTYSVQVPLRAQAIQLSFSAPRAQAKELSALAQGVLASVDGDSNWLTDAERSRKLGQSLGTFLGILGAIFYVVYARRRRRGMTRRM